MKFGSVVIGLILPVTLLSAAPPVWWTEESTRILESGSTPDLSVNYAPANLGQLKHIAAQAKKHLDAKLPGGSGSTVAALVTGFGNALSPSELAANYAPVNLGQLKAVAKPFYDRLLAAGYDTKANLIAHGYPSSWSYSHPWDPFTPVSENYVPVNLGQLKLVFSFDLAVDTDDDGLPDWWENAHGLNSGLADENNNGVDDGLDDFDWDGQSNGLELTQGTDPMKPNGPDTDGDGMVDTTEPHRGRVVGTKDHPEVNLHFILK